MNYVTHFRGIISWAVEAMAELIDLNYIIRIGSLTNIFLDIYVMYLHEVESIFHFVSICPTILRSIKTDWLRNAVLARWEFA